MTDDCNYYQTVTFRIQRPADISPEDWIAANKRYMRRQRIRRRIVRHIERLAYRRSEAAGALWDRMNNVHPSTET